MSKFIQGDRVVLNLELGTVSDVLAEDPFHGRLYEVILDKYATSRMYCYENEFLTINEACAKLKQLINQRGSQ